MPRRTSDRSGDRPIHPTIALLVGAVARVASALTPTPVLTIVALCGAVAGIDARVATFRAVLPGFPTARTRSR